MIDRKAIESEASAWIAQLDGGKPSQQDLAALREWMGRSPAHKQAFEHLAKLWDDANVLTLLSVPRARDARSRNVLRRFLVPLPLTAALAVLALGTLIFVSYEPITAALHSLGGSTASAAYATVVGEQRRVTLRDGSNITLNTNSEVRIAYDRDVRHVDLIRGEVLFEVAHDTSRPFLVRAGRGFVRAVGTAFSVYLRDPDDVGVIVTEGRVELSAMREGSPDRGTSGESRTVLATLKARESARFGRTLESRQTLAQPELARRMAWQQGELQFDGDVLSDVVEEVSRYTTQRIVIRDPSLRDVRVGGYFKVGETEAMFEALETSFGVHVERVSNDLVYLTRGAE